MIHRAVEHFEDPENRWGLANAWDCLHKVYLAQGKIEPARRLLNRAIHVIDGCGLLSTEGTLGNSLAGLLMIEKYFSKALACLERLFKKEIPKKPPGLKISLLGRFKLTIGNQDIPSSRWKNSKALMILKYLAANRQKGFIPREVLIEMLWPDDDIRKTGSRFNMAMSVLRKTLQPQLAPKKASAYIERKKDTYRLNGDITISIDAEHFSESLKSAKAVKNNLQKALERYLLAESFYQGPFLEEDPYEEWCMEKRERFASDYLMILKAIKTIYDEQKDNGSTALYSQKILKADPFDENALRKLMTLHAGSGNLTEIKKMYMHHIKAAEEMDCPVSAEITEMYKRLT